jgi:hypothetical protein
MKKYPIEPPLRSGIEEAGIALIDTLNRHDDGQWVAVRVRDGTGWEIVRPRSQQAILDACATPSQPDSTESVNDPDAKGKA